MGIIPFKEDHGIVDYVMPLKIVEYFNLGIPCVSYVNKGIVDEFGEEGVFFYSPNNWLGYSKLDDAIDLAINGMSPDLSKSLRDKTKHYDWDNLFAPLGDFIKSNYLKELTRMYQKGLSVIILNWNGLGLLKKSLDSVIRAKRESDFDIEVIVADNGSSMDRSVDVLKDFYDDEVRIVELGVNHGFSKGNNLAAKEASYDSLLFLNNDVNVPLDFFKVLYNEFSL